MPKCTLLIGGARSGKSNFAQELAVKSGKPVLFVATATAGDDEMRQRIEQHKKSRPSNWTTLETPVHIGNHILNAFDKSQIVLIDCITLLVNNIFLNNSDNNTEGQLDTSFLEKEVKTEIEELVSCINQVKTSFIIVTNEVGLGLVPPNEIGRLYRDLLGKANQILARRADEVYLMVAGIPLLVKPHNSR